MAPKISFAKTFLSAVRLPAGERGAALVDRMRANSDHITRSAAEHLVERIRNSTQNLALHHQLNAVVEGLDAVARYDFPVTNSIRAANRLGLAFISTAERSFLSLKREAEDMIRAGAANLIVDLESIYTSHPRIAELSRTDTAIEDMVKNSPTIISGYSWTRQKSEGKNLPMVTEEIDLELALSETAYKIELRWPVNILYGISSLARSDLAGHIWRDDSSLENLFLNLGFDPKYVTVVEAFAAVPVPPQNTTNEVLFEPRGVLTVSSKDTEDYFIYFKINDNLCLNITELAGRQTKEVPEHGPDDEKRDLIDLEPVPASAIANGLLSSRRDGKLIVIAIPAIVNNEDEEVAVSDPDPIRRPIIFEINLIGMSKDSSMLEFMRAVWALKRRSGQEYIM